jgi:hypothetical protein
MAKTFLELQNEALEIVDDTLTRSRNIIKKGINEAYAEIAGIRDWDTLLNNTTVTTVSGTQEYTPIVSSDAVPRIRRITSIVDETNNRELQEVRRDVFKKNYPYVASTDTGDVTIFYISGYDTNRDIKFKVYKVPNSSLTLRVEYYEEPLEAQSDDHIFRIPDQFHSGLIYLGIARYYEFHKDPAANYYRELHEELKAKILGIEYGETDEMPSFQPQQLKSNCIVGKIGRIYN